MEPFGKYSSDKSPVSLEAMVTIDILYEDDGCVVVAKPPRLLTHGHPRFPEEISLIERVQTQLQRKMYIVHRLDRGASGCLLISKEPQLVQGYKKKLQEGRKSYIALCRGVYRGDSPIVCSNPMNVKGVRKEASSRIQCLATIENPRSSLFFVQPHTGRYHQVRRHLRDYTHPILGDSEHGDSKVNRWWRENMGLERLALHAYSIACGDFFVSCPLFDDHKLLYQRLDIKRF
jgi:tRNA pseudouridine65 synthase